MGSSRVLVIGPDVEAQMARFRKFEETGWVDQYVVSFDILARERERWLRSWSEKEEWYVQDPAGRLHEVFEKDQLGNHLFIGAPTPDEPSNANRTPTLEQQIFGSNSYVDITDETGQKRWWLVLAIPDNHKVIRAKFKEFMSFNDWLTKYHGYPVVADNAVPELDGAHKIGWMRLDHDGNVIELIERTIPGGRWYPSWKVVGDAWKLKSGALSNQNLLTTEQNNFAGSARKSDIDFAGMNAQMEMEAGACWDNAKRDPKAFENIEISGWYYREFIHLPREQYIHRMQDINLWGQNLILDRRYIDQVPPEFQPVSDDASANARPPWYAYIRKVIDDLPNDTLMTMVSYRC